MITVIIPVHNRPRLIEIALRSLLNQTLPPTEILVVDDGSTDDTAAVVDAFGPPVRRLYQSSQGAAAARNAGLREATGEFIAFLDSDDYWAPDALAILHQALLSPPSKGVVYGRSTLFQGDEEDEEDLKETSLLPAPSSAGPPVCQPGTFLAHAHVFATVGDLNPALGAGEMIDWYSRAQQAQVVMQPVDHPILHRRIHPGNMTRHKEATAQPYAQMLALHLKRLRQKPD